VLVVVGSSARAQPEKTVRPIIDSAGAGKPLVAFIAPDAPEALSALTRGGVPNFHTPEACADAIAAALARQPPKITGGQIPRVSGGDGRMLDELDAGEFLDRLGIARAPSVAIAAEVANAPVLPFGYPVAVKVLAAEIAHKTDVGGVVLGVPDGAALIAAIRKIAAEVAARKPGTRVERVLVQPMLSGLGEALVGYRVDRDVGPIVMVAAGGILAELAHDRSLRLAPVDLDTAREMIAEVRGLPQQAQGRSRRAGAGDRRAVAARRRPHNRRGRDQSADRAACRTGRRRGRRAGEACRERLGFGHELFDRGNDHVPRRSPADASSRRWRNRRRRGLCECAALR
jgi:hypothetical protein